MAALQRLSLREQSAVEFWGLGAVWSLSLHRCLRCVYDAQGPRSIV